MRRLDGCSSRRFTLKIILLLAILLIPFLLSGLTVSHTVTEKDLSWKDYAASSGNSYIVAGSFRQFDVVLDRDVEKVTVLAYHGDSIPGAGDRSSSNYYRWEYDNGVWKDVSGHDSEYIDSSKCEKNDFTYSFFIGIDRGANRGSWKVIIHVDDDEKIESTFSIEVVSHFNFFLLSLIGVYAPDTKYKRAVADIEFFISEKKKIITDTQTTVENKVDSILNRRRPPDKEEKLSKNPADIFVFNNSPPLKKEMERSTVSTYSKSKLKIEKSNSDNTYFLKKKGDGIKVFRSAKITGHKRFFALILTILLLSVVFVPAYSTEDTSSTSESMISESDINPENLNSSDMILINVTDSGNSPLKPESDYDNITELENQTSVIIDCENNLTNSSIDFNITNAAFFIQNETLNETIEPSFVTPDSNDIGMIEEELENNTFVTTMQFDAEINNPVKWKKEIKFENKKGSTRKLTRELTLPDPADNISITGSDDATPEYNLIYDFNDSTYIELNETLGPNENKSVIIEYSTPGPTISEYEIAPSKKRVSISSDIHYTNITAYADVGNVPIGSIILFHLVNDARVEIEFTSIDTNNDNLIDRIEWIVPHLSEQIYEIIIDVRQVEHLDVNRQFISDITDEVIAKDDVWSESIDNDEYVRIKFERNLEGHNDISIYARSNGNSDIEVYTKDGNNLITKFSNVTGENWYKVYLTNLSGSHDTFDLRTIGNYVEYDYIVDPPPITSVDSINPYIQTVSPITITATESAPADNVTLYYRWSDDNASWESSWSNLFYETWSSGTDGNYQGDDTPDPDGDFSDMWWFIKEDTEDLSDIMVGSYGNSGEETNCIYFRDNDNNQYGEPRDSDGSYWNASGSGWLDGYINFTYDYYVDNNEGVNLDVWRGSSWTNVWSDINTNGANQEAADPGWATQSYQLVAADLAAEEFSFRIELVGPGGQDRLFVDNITLEVESDLWFNYSGDTNPDEESPWSWSFNFPNGTGYYEFFSIGKKAGETDETAPLSADAICHYDPSLNTAPIQSYEGPVNDSSDIGLSPQLNVTVDDIDKNLLNAYWYSNSSGEWIQFGYNVSIDTSSGSVNIIQPNSNFTERNKTYWWSVNLTDTLGWTNNTYHLTTRENFTPEPPSLFSSTPNGRFQIDITWNDHSYADSTYVECHTSDDPLWDRGDHIYLYNDSTSSVSHSGLDPSSTWFYKAWSWNSTDNVWGLGNTTSNTTEDNIAPNYGTPDPANNSIDQPVILAWNIEISDIEGDTFNWTIECENGDSNSANDDTDGIKQLSLSGLDYETSYTIWVNTTDSYNWTREWFTFTTEEPTNSPTVGSENPLNDSIGIATLPELSVIVDDANDDLMTTYWYSNCTGDWFEFGKNLSIDPSTGPVTITQNNNNFSDINQTYWWSVNVSDGSLWTNVTYHFTTNQIPTQSGESPVNESSNIELLPSLHVICDDADSDLMTAYWYSNSTGDWEIFDTTSSISTGTNISSTNSNFTDYSTTYYWSVNITDEKNWKNYTYYFTTRIVNTPDPPGSFTATQNGRFQIDLTWTDHENADTTYIEWHTSDDPIWNRGDYNFLYNDSTESTSHTSLDPGTTYYYKAWSWNQTDNAWSSASEDDEPTVSNILPTQTWENPANMSTGINLLPILNVTVDDAEDDFLNVTWYSNSTGSWLPFGINSSIDTSSGEVSISQTNSNFSDNYQTYWWKVEISDDYNGWSNETYYFTTIQTMNTAIDPISPYRQTSSPTTITATESGGIPDNVTLYYRWSDDNASWSGGGWTNLVFDDFEDGTYGNFSEEDVDGDVTINGASWVDGTNSVYLRDDTGANLYLTDTISAATIGYSQIKVDFSFAVDDFNNPGTEDWWFQYYNGSSGSWETVYDYDCGAGTYIDQNAGSDWDTNGIIRHGYYFNESDGWTLSDDFRVRFYCDASGNADDLYIDSIYINATTGGTGIDWTMWSGTNPDESSPWSWDFNFPEGEGYYEFYSIGKKTGFSDESAPASADSICKYNLAPTITNEGPTSGSSELELNPTLNVTVNDNDELTVYWYDNSSGSWSLFATNESIDTSSGEVNISQIPMNFNNYGTKYWWSVNVNDGTFWTNETYHFETNYYPDINYPNPTNQSTDLDPTPVCNVTVSDVDGGNVDVYFYENTTGSWVLQQVNSSVDVTGAANVEWDNFNNASEYDTKYWWKVNVADQNGLSVEKIYHFTTSFYPDISDEDPENDSTSVPFTPICSITVADNDGGTVDVYFYENSSNPLIWEIQQINSSVDVTTPAYVEWDNYNNATESDFDYWWKVNVIDSKGLSTEEIYHFTSATQNPPTQSWENPTDTSTNIPISTTSINVTIEDPDGDSLNWTFETSPNIGSQDNSSSAEGNGSKNCSISGLTYGTTYTWYVNVSDGIDWSNETYTFTTGYLPEINYPGPINGSTGIGLEPICNITVSDPDGGLVDVYFYDNSSGPWDQRQLNSSVDVTSPANVEWNNYDGASIYNMTYWWKVVVTDDLGYSYEDIFHFTTEPLNTSVDSISPYQHSLGPISISATNYTDVDNVTLYYRWSDDNSSWDAGTGQYNDTINNLNPDYRWMLDGNELDIIDGDGNSDGGDDPVWVDNIIPKSPAAQCGDYVPDDYTSVPNQGDINDGTTYDRSISVWFFADTIDTTGNGRIIWEEGGGTNWLNIYTHEESGEDRLYFTMGEGGGTGVVDYMYTTITTGTLYHVGIIVNMVDEEMYMYLNGNLVASDTDGFNIGAELSSHTGSPAIGGDDGSPLGWDMAEVSGNFDGRIADLCYWGDTSPLLSGNDMIDIYNKGILGNGINWTLWNDPTNPDENSPWEWNFDFPNYNGYYEFYSIGKKSGISDEPSPIIADAICYYNNYSRPLINSYELINLTGSKLNNETGLLEVNNEYTFQINITEPNGWANLDYITIDAWFDKGSDSTIYNQSDNLGGNLNMKLQYENTTGIAEFSMLWPDDESQIVIGNCTEEKISDTTRIINFSFIPGSQIRWANGDGEWDTSQNSTNDQNSWNFNITARDSTSLSDWKLDEYGIYRYTSISPSDNWLDVIASPGFSDSSNIVTITYSSNYDFDMTIYFEENLYNETWDSTIPIANNVDILASADPNDDINTDQIFAGIEEINAIDIFNDSGIFNNNNLSQTVDVQFDVFIPFGTFGGVYTARIATKIIQDDF